MTREEEIRQAQVAIYGTEHCRAAEHFEQGASWADTHPHWISVNDELPKENGRYLFYHDIIGVQFAYYYNDLTLDKAVTHWMPIPQPPKKGD